LDFRFSIEQQGQDAHRHDDMDGAPPVVGVVRDGGCRPLSEKMDLGATGAPFAAVVWGIRIPHGCKQRTRGTLKPPLTDHQAPQSKIENQKSKMFYVW
jgi:hypothetical protein